MKCFRLPLLALLPGLVVASVGWGDCCSGYIPPMPSYSGPIPSLPTSHPPVPAMPAPVTCQSIGLVGWWKFDEGSGTTAADSSGGGNTGTLVNNPTWVAGHTNNALGFNGSNNYVSVTDNPLLHLTGEATYALWFKATSLSADSDLIDKGCGGYTFWYKSSLQQIMFGRQCDSTISHEWAKVSFNTTGSWHHIVGTYSSGTLSLYIDGALVDTTSRNTSITSTGALTIGAGVVAGQSDGYFDGSIDDVRIFNRALTAAEVKQLYDSTGP